MSDYTPLVVDVRSVSEYNAGHVSCAFNLELQHDFDLIENELVCLTKGKKDFPIRLYCRSGMYCVYVNT